MYDWVVGVAQSPNAPPSSWHRTVLTSSFGWKLNEAVDADVVLGGVEEIATSIGSGSSWITFTVPVSVGPPGWNGNGG